MRILIADDDHEMREMYATIFEGHDLTIVRDGAAAVHEYHKQGAFDYVVTDYQMPKKNGVVVVMEIRAINPKQPIVLCSGDPPTLNAMTKELTGEFAMLQKPFRPSVLRKLVTGEE